MGDHVEGGRVMIFIEHQTTSGMDDEQALPPFWEGNAWHVVRRLPDQKTLWRRISLRTRSEAAE
jgi:hypothetical protein